MGSLADFDREVQDMVTANKLSASRVKSVTEAAMANIESDAHIVATLFRVHKQAKSSHKLSCLYIIDAISREAKHQVKRSRDKGKQVEDDTGSATPTGEADDTDSRRRDKIKGTHASFLSKIENFLDRLVGDVLTKGPPEHKEKVKKVLDIWTKTSTFSPEALKAPYARLRGEIMSSDANANRRADAGKANGTSTSQNSSADLAKGGSARSTTPPFSPPLQARTFPPLPAIITQAIPPLGDLSSLTGLLGNIGGASPVPGTSSVVPAASLDSLASFLGIPQQPQAAPTQPASVFDGSQFALLQQLASSNAAPPLPMPLPIPMQPSSFPMPPAHIMNRMQTAFPPLPQRQGPPQHQLGGFPGAGIGPPGFDRPNGNFNGVPSRFDSNGGFQDQSPMRQNVGQGRRSMSPPDRHRGPPSDHRQRDRPDSSTGPPPRDAREVAEQASKRVKSSRWDTPGAVPEPEVEKPQAIATMISEDRPDPPQQGAGRQRPPHRQEALEARPPKTEQNTDNRTGEDSGHQQGFADEEEETARAAAKLLEDAQPFNPQTFDSLKPECWASFANMCQQMMGYMPSNTEMISFIMSRMAMMQSAAAMGMGMSMNMLNNQIAQANGNTSEQQDQDAASKVGQQDVSMGGADIKEEPKPQAQPEGSFQPATADDADDGGEAEMDLANDD